MRTEDGAVVLLHVVQDVKLELMHCTSVDWGSNTKCLAAPVVII